MYLNLVGRVEGFPRHPLPGTGFSTLDVDIDRDRGECLASFGDGSVAGILIAGLLDHASPLAAVALLRECRRVLIDGAHVRVVVGREVRSTPGESVSAPPDEHTIARYANLSGLPFVERALPNQSYLLPFRNLEGTTAPSCVFELEKLKYEVAREPLVSIVIPAYKVTYFRACLESALAQTWRNIEIVICDDSPGDEIGRVVDALRSPKIKYSKNERRLGGGNNYLRALEMSRGEYTKLLSDDDLLHPNCVERMARCLQAYPDVTVVTSHRMFIDENSKRIEGAFFERRPVAEDSWVDGLSATNLMLGTKQNFIGEPSTSLMRKLDLNHIKPHIFSFDFVHSHGNGDVSMWMSLLSRGHLIYLVESLSSFRIHPAQQQNDPNVHADAIRAWDFDREVGESFGLYDSKKSKSLVTRPLGRRPWWSDVVSEKFLEVRRSTEEGDLAAAQSIADAVLTLESDPSVALQVAEWHSTHGDPANAIVILDGVVREHPEQVGAHFARANAFRFMGEDERAAKALIDASTRASVISPGVGARSNGSEVLLEPKASIRVAAAALPLTMTFEVRTSSTENIRYPVPVRIRVGSENRVGCVLQRKGQTEVVVLTLNESSVDVDVSLEWRMEGVAPVNRPLEEVDRAQSVVTLGKLGAWPLPLRQRFNKAAPPIDLPTQASIRFLCTPDRSDKEWLQPVDAYLESFSGSKASVSLIVRVEPPTEEATRHIHSAVNQRIEQLKLSPEMCPDITLEATVLTESERAGLYTAATAYLQTGGLRGKVRAAEAGACGLIILNARGKEGWKDVFQKALPEPPGLGKT